MSVLAIDVAVLVPDPVAGIAADTSRELAAGQRGALRLDDTHHPHITLAQQFIDESRLSDLLEELDRLLRHEPELALRLAGASADHRTIAFVVDDSPDLQRLHEAIMDAIEPFESPDGGADAFQSGGETIRAQDVDWVRNYRENSAYAHYRPHVTVGHAARAPQVEPVEFEAARIAVCRLGRFCTCRTILREWALGGR